MKRAAQVLDEVRGAMGGHDRWEGRSARVLEAGGKWRVACGEGRYEPAKRNAAIARSSGVALNFQIAGEGEKLSSYEICLAWPPASGAPEGLNSDSPPFWSLMFHLDPTRVAWPRHPLYHLQMTCGDMTARPPFANWRLPFNESDPSRLIEFLTAHVT